MSSPWILLAAGTAGGLLAGLLGLGGGVVINPILMALGLPPRFATASTAAAIVGNSAAATVYNASEHKVDWSLGCWLGGGAVLGALSGSMVIARFEDPQLLDQVIRAGFLLILLLAARRLLHRPPAGEHAPSPLMLELPFRLKTTLSDQPLSPLVPALATAAVAFVGSFLGIGGAVLLIPMLMQLSGSTIRKAIPVIQLAILFGALAAGTGHILFNGNLRPEVAFWLVLGGSLGTPAGIWLKRRVSDRFLRIVYAGVIGLSFAKIAAGLFGADPAPATAASSGYGGQSPAWVWITSIGFALLWGPASAWCMRKLGRG